MDRLAHDALLAVNALLERHGARPLDAWVASPPGLSPVELAVSHMAAAHDVRWQFGTLRWVWTWGVHTYWTPPESVRHFVTDWETGKYPDLVAAGPF